MNLTALPYGNAKEQQSGNGTWTFTCQHGADECQANLIETCGIVTYPNQAEWFPFYSCIEGSSSPQTAGPTCASQTSLDWSKINACVTGPAGNAAEHAVALATNALAIQYTPWLVINGKHIPDQQTGNMLKLVCNAYTGTKPSGCPADDDE